MPLIGDRTTATRIVHGDFSGLSEMSAGSCRQVYLDYDNDVVYKVTRSYIDEGSGYDNLTEYRVARRLLSKCRNNDQWLTPHIRIPLVSMFSVGGTFVIAMQFIEGTTGYSSRGRLSREAAADLRRLNFRDMHGQNFVVDHDGVVWPIDFTRRTAWGDLYDSGADDRMFEVV